MKDLRGKVAAITGAASGIGRAMACCLAREGCQLALSDIDGPGLNDTTKVVGGEAKVTTSIVDVSDHTAVSAWAEQAFQEHGRVDMIINNAGVSVAQVLEDVTYEDFEWVMNINFWGVVHGSKAFLPYLRRQPEGHIVNIASINGILPFPNNGPYNAAKFAVKGFSETLTQELEGTNVRVTSVYPGGVKTNIARNARFYRSANATSREVGIETFDRIVGQTADQAAADIVTGIKRGKKRLLVGRQAKLMDVCARVLPVLSLTMVRRIVSSSGQSMPRLLKRGAERGGGSRGALRPRMR